MDTQNNTTTANPLDVAVRDLCGKVDAYLKQGCLRSELYHVNERVKALLKTLPESAKRVYKDCNGCEYNRTVKDQIGWQFRGCFGGEYKGKPIAEIELCPLKVATLPEQPVEYPTSTEMIAEWENNELPLLRDKDFRGDAERMAYNAFMDGFAKGLGYKK